MRQSPVALHSALFLWLLQSLLYTPSDVMAEQRLPVDKLYTMCGIESVLIFVRRSDYLFYQAVVEVLVPDVLRPVPSE